MGMYYRNDRSIVVRIDGADHHHHGYRSGRHDLRHAVTGLAYVAKDEDGVVGLLTDEGFDDLLDAGRLEIVSTRSPDRVRLLNDASELTIAQACDLDPYVRKMLVQIEMLDDAGIRNGDKSIERHFDRDGKWTAELEAQWGPHDAPRTIRNWRSKRGAAGCRHPKQMVRLRGRLARTMWNDVETELQWKHALLSISSDMSIHSSWTCYGDELKLVNEGRHPVHPAPDVAYRHVSERTFRRRVERLVMDETEASKKGVAALEQDWRGGGRPLTAGHVMQSVIIDHTRLDLFVVDDEREMVLGRPWLTVAVDVRTRAVVAHVLTFVEPSIATVGETLRRMAMPKRPPTDLGRKWPVLRRLRGRPDRIIVDNAVEFRSRMLEAAARGLGFSVRYCPVKKPRYRAIVERAIGTLNKIICAEMPGRALPPADVRRLEYDGEGLAVVIMDELEAVTNWGIAEYNISPHAGIQNRAPAEYFQSEAARTGVMNFRDLRRFRIETMDVSDPVQLDAAGITQWHLRWHDHARVPDLLNDLTQAEPKRKRREDATATVTFRYDPLDISVIFVWNRVSQEYVELRCADEEYAHGMPLAFHLELVDRANRRKEGFSTEEERIAVRTRRIAAIRAISPDATAKARREVARLMEIPRLRAITGNIVDLEFRTSHEEDMEGFIGCDPASYTALDMEILGRRKFGGAKAHPGADADVPERGTGLTDEPDDAPPPLRRGGPLTRGGYR
jgi:putative transposase